MDPKLYHQLELALDTVDTLIAIKDMNGVYVYVNKAVDEYYREKYDSIVGKNFREVYPPSEQEIVQRLDQEVITQRQIINKTIQVYTDDGHIYVDSSRSPVFDDDGHIIGIISAGKNVTEREEAKIQLAETLEALEELNHKYYQLAYID